MTAIRLLREAEEEPRLAAQFYEEAQPGLGQALIFDAEAQPWLLLAIVNGPCDEAENKGVERIAGPNITKASAASVQSSRRKTSTPRSDALVS